MLIRIISYKIKPNQFSKFVQFVNKCICFFTGSEYWHTAIELGEYKYESGHPYGAEKTRMKTVADEYTDVHSIEISDISFNAMKEYAELKLKQNLRYNHYKLLVLAICYPTRWLWNKLKWVPFQNNFFGMVCSVFVREILLAGGIDFIPHYKELTAPGDFIKYRSK